MKILLRLPTWLGDSVMATPTFETLKTHYPQASFTLVGSCISLGIFEREAQCQLILDESKNAKSRFLALYRLAKQLGKHDLAITLQNNLPSALLLFFTQSTQRIGYAKNFRSALLTTTLKPLPHLHQVEQYLHLLSPLGIPLPTQAKLHLTAKPSAKAEKIRIGINTGATYGSAKRWIEEYFIQVIETLLLQDYEVVLYGGREEIEANTRITNALQTPKQNFHNLTAQTSITELIDSIASLDLFLTNDSGPMHIASSLSIPLVAIFGPTDCKETSPYNTTNPQIILNQHLPCSPCKKRECPFKHHQCMTLITPQEVLNAIKTLLSRKGINNV